MPLIIKKTCGTLKRACLALIPCHKIRKTTTLPKRKRAYLAPFHQETEPWIKGSDKKTGKKSFKRLMKIYELYLNFQNFADLMIF